MERGQLVLRFVTNTVPSGWYGYFYDQDGHLIAEHDGSTGAPIREYVWLGDIPVAVIEAGTSPTVSYIHPDHLGRPIAMTDAAGAFVNETTWVAFGGIHVMTGSVGLDLLFPGQWYQHEGGLHYNWHRSYDPTIARYTQPDPLGLVDGPSRYAYVGSDPLQRVDPSGLAELPFPHNVPGGPWTAAGPGQLPGHYYGPAQESGPRSQCQYVPPEGVGGPSRLAGLLENSSAGPIRLEPI